MQVHKRKLLKISVQKILPCQCRVIKKTINKFVKCVLILYYKVYIIKWILTPFIDTYVRGPGFERLRLGLLFLLGWALPVALFIISS